MHGSMTRSGQPGHYTSDYTPLRPAARTLTDMEKSPTLQRTGEPPGPHYVGPGAEGAEGAEGKMEEKEEEEEEEGRCRWGPVSPSCCQSFRQPVWMLVCLCWAGATQGMVVNGFVNVVISTVERRFEMSSTESGLIASCYDIAAVLCLVPVTYFGGRGRKPVYLAVGLLILGVGSFVFCLPHFTTGLYSVGQAQDSMCVGGNASFCLTSNGSLSNYRFVFYLGQLLHGVGATPLYTLGTTYLDENLPAVSNSLYQGVFYTSSILGPGLGYLAGGAFLNIFTDFNQLDVSELTLDNDNPRWVGSWWFGFLVSGTLALFICVPFFGFPKSLPGSERYRAEKEKEVYKGKDKTAPEELENQPLGLQHILSSVRCLVSNPTFMFLNLASASHGAIISGLSTFAPKFVEFKFGLTSAAAAQYVGIVAIGMGGLAILSGGWLVKRFGWSVRQTLKFCVVATLVTEGCYFIFLVDCINLPFAGVSVQYQHPRTSGGEEYLRLAQLDATCNAGCGCSMLDYNPVCGRDDVMYYSPCYAGCSRSTANDSSKYSNCSCVMYNYTAEDVADSQLWMVREGKCDSDCPLLIAFLVVSGVMLFGLFVTSVPSLNATLRCVTQDHRSLAIGIQSITGRCLGTIPGPILMGKIIDITCLVWHESCEGDGACFYYDNTAMSLNLLAVGLAFNLLSVCFFSFSLYFYRSDSSDVSLGVEVSEEPAISSQQTSVTNITLASTSSHEQDEVPQVEVHEDEDPTQHDDVPPSSTHSSPNSSSSSV